MKRFLAAALIFCILFSSFSLTTSAKTTSEDFVERMKKTYGVNIIEDIPSTPEGRQYVENALAFIGEEVINSITSIKSLSIYFRAKKNSSTLGSSGSNASGYYVILYDGFPSTTPIHELMHVVNFALDLYVSDIDDVIASYNDGRKYGTTWETSDKHYFGYSYGKTRASDDIATIPGSIYANRDGIADRIKSNESPALRKKWEYLRDLCNLYLGQSPMFAILGNQKPTPKKIELSASVLNLTVGETHKLTATVLPEGTGAKVSFKSSSKIVSIDAKGNITANSTGSATITVQAGRVKAVCTVYVKKATPAPTPTTGNNNIKNEVSLQSYPTKRTYVIGEGFDISGLKVVNNTGSKVNDISDKILFYTSETVILTQGRPFTTTGTKVIKLMQADGKVIGEYTITVKDKTPTVNHPFTDVTSGVYYEKAVIWALKNNITGGTSGTTFSPYTTCTRGQVVTFLWKAKGQPEPNSTYNPFTDVNPNDYFYKAVLWAVENNITSGTSATTFSPNKTCNSGQVVTFLWKSNGKPSAKVASSIAVQYSGKYYTDAIAWADSIGLLSGTGIAFVPNNNSPRAEIVTYLYRNAGSPAVSTSADTAENSDVLKDGTYYIKASKNTNFVMDLTGSSKEDGAKLIIFTNYGTSNQKFIVTKVGDHKYKIQCVHSGKWWKSSGTKGAILTQTGSASDNSAITFTITKQANGTYRIMDSKGLYVGISGGKIQDETNVILWTEASDESQTYLFEKID